ncbi:Hypp6856 [Branchiostoma lanceolatum]|uniref:Hypp6856 protein n=1 Tax=Branchiostoma lanceolatum TaxID=7740 RepID=A0A8K0EB91_BRALA|nr:Hypp6856 [Branchiostoma lanceolatum]
MERAAKDLCQSQRLRGASDVSSLRRLPRGHNRFVLQPLADQLPPAQGTFRWAIAFSVTNRAENSFMQTAPTPTPAPTAVAPTKPTSEFDYVTLRESGQAGANLDGHISASFRENSGKGADSEVVVPDDYLSLDETLYPMRTQVRFKQFNPSKPAKYGLLFKSINAARYPYTFAVAPYSAKPAAGDGEYYVQGTESTVRSLVEGLETSINLRGRNISFDRLYTSISWLLDRGITTVGTLNSNRAFPVK